MILFQVIHNFLYLDRNQVLTLNPLTLTEQEAAIRCVFRNHKTFVASINDPKGILSKFLSFFNSISLRKVRKHSYKNAS